MTRMIILATSICLAFVQSSRAQVPALNWDEVHYTGQGTNVGKRVLIGQDTAVYAFGQGGNFCYLAKYRSYDGLPLWSAQWDSATVAVDLALHPNGMLVAAWTYFNEPFNSPLDIGVSAYDADGAPLWTFTWNDSLNRDDIVRDLHIDANGDIVLCATTEELSGNPSAFNNISVLKLDNTGNLIWRRTWNGTLNNDDEPSAIWTDADNNVYVAGYTTNAGINGKDMLLLKYDADGALQWSQSVNRNAGFGNHIDIASHVRTNSVGNIILAGTTESPDSDFGQDLSVYGFSAAGSLLWQRHYDHQNEEAAVDMEIDALGRILVLGRTSSTNGNGEVLFRLAPSGALDWAALNITNAIGPPFPHALALGLDGQIITTGMVGDQLLRDAYVRAYGSDGEDLWTYRYTSPNSFNEEEGHDVAVGENGAIYMTGHYDQSGQSLERGVTLCLCPEQEGVCFLEPTMEPALPITEMVGVDLDQDGWRDIVIGTPLQSILGVYMGGPAGFTLTFPVVVPAQPSLLASGDLDQDGDEDVVAGVLGSPDLWVVLNSGGTLGYSGTLSTSQGVMDMKVVDIDGQNGPDIVAIMNGAPYLVVMLNNGSGSFTASNPVSVPNPYRMAAGDVDADGSVDLLIGRFVQDSIYVLHGNGDGTFGPPDGFVSGITGSAIVGIGDFTFDGINDLVTCNGINAWGVRPGLGGGAFGAPITGTTGAVNEFIIAPFPEDTTFRLLAANYSSTSKVSYSSCSFMHSATQLVATAPGNHLVEVADWTNDGSPDLLSYYTGGEIHLWRNCDTLDITTIDPELMAPPGNNGLITFPSPTSGTTTIVRPLGITGPVELTLWSQHGALVQQWIMNTPVVVMELNAYSEGMYLLRCKSAERSWSARVVVMREAR